jgi:hypothetical protein
MSVPLDRFFEAMLPFLERRASVEETVRVLGPSPSGNGRLALYPELVRRQKRSLLDHFFAAVRAACEAHEPGLWERLAEEYVRELAPRHWEPNHYAEPMLAFLAARQERSGALPPAAFELADFAWVRFSAMIAAHPEGADPAIGRALFVRHYDHDVATYALAVESGAPRPAPGPERVATTLLVCRSRRSGRLEIVRPSLAGLVALRRREAPDEPPRRPRGLTEDDVAREDAALVELGALADRAASPPP